METLPLSLPPSLSLSASNRRALHAVIAGGSFAEAARQIGISQPAVAQQIREMEQRCATRLFERHAGRLVPTPICEELSEVTERMDALQQQAQRILDRRRSIHEGTLRIGLGNSMPGMALIAAFQKDYPTVTLSVVLSDYAQIIKAVIERRIDLGVLPNVPGDGRFVREVLVEQEVVAIAHPDHPIARHARLDCGQLARVPLIFRSRGSSTQTIVDRAFRRAALAPNARLTLDTRDGVYEAVANGLGVGFMWRFGTGRTDTIRRMPIIDIGPPCPESAFRLSETSDPLTDAFFGKARIFRRSAAIFSHCPASALVGPIGAFREGRISGSS